MSRGIYKIINIVNNKFYVGSAVNLQRRRSRHFSELRTGVHNNRHLQAAWNKYGEEAFIFVVVEEAQPLDNILELEDKWLKDHAGKDYCYNIGVTALAPMLGMTKTLSPTWGYKHTEEAKAKIGSSSKGRIPSKETIEKRRKSMRGRQVTSATRAKIRLKLTGEGNYWYGKKRPDHGAKVSKAVIYIDAKGVAHEYASIQALRDARGLKPSTVNRTIKSGKCIAKGPHAGCCIRYK